MKGNQIMKNEKLDSVKKGRPMSKKEEDIFDRRLAQLVMGHDLIIQSSGSKHTPPELRDAIVDGIWLAIDHGAYEAFDKKGKGAIAFKKPLKLEPFEDKEEKARFEETLTAIGKPIDD